MKRMLYNRRGFLALLALLGFVAVAVGGAIPFLSRELPEPAKANRQDLLRWLILKDLTKETAATQLVLAERLEAEFATGVDWAEFQEKLDAAHRDRLLKNIPYVLRAWILEKAEAYGRLAEDRRTEFLDRLIGTLEVWQGVEKLLPSGTSGSTSSKGEKSPKLATILMQEIEEFEKTLPGRQKKQVQKFWGDLQMRWFLRSMGWKS